MDQSLRDRVRGSAIWAAYGDALGFITELTDKIGLRRRAGADRVVETVAWRRLVGGRFGPIVTLPPGCYSDDTQLRLATCRAIRCDGHFDVEAFAKIELPVWLSYSLGAGSGTKAAAANLAGADVNWFSNFFKVKSASYFEGGGNGAAMRIQPHIWVSPQKADDQTYLAPLIRNAICTHGHARGIAGAVLHGLTLADVLVNERLISPDRWPDFVGRFPKIAKATNDDRELRSFWLPVWEERVGDSFQNAVRVVEEECLRDIEAIRHLVDGATEEGYRKVLETLGGLDPRTRGSGTKTVLAALALCWMYRDEAPETALVAAVNVLGSDTDTIATIAAAIIGAATRQLPKGTLMDREYIETEANRLYNSSYGQRGTSFPYPDLMTWTPPKTQSDAVGLAHGTFALTGLGRAEGMGSPIIGQGKDPGAWHWMKLEFGQVLIAKFRRSLVDNGTVPPDFPPAQQAEDAPTLKPSSTGQDQRIPKRTSTALQESLFAPEPIYRANATKGEYDRTLDQLTSEAIRSGFAPDLIGRHILSLSEQSDGIERVVSYAAIIAKAKKARMARR